MIKHKIKVPEPNVKRFGNAISHYEPSNEDVRKVKYEMHVNGYTIGHESGKKLCDLGFFLDPFLFGQALIETLNNIGFSFSDPRLQLTLRNTPPHHFTYVVYDNPEKRDQKWKAALEIIKGDSEFAGYIESETVPLSNFVHKPDPTSPTTIDIAALGRKPFALPNPELIEVPIGKKKACDIHVKRILAPLDELDYFFLHNGYYLVLTPRGHKILTIQAESIHDGVTAYRTLVEHLVPVGGYKQIDIEITGHYYRQPADVSVAQIVRKGCFSEK